jgi:hypothetical protein
VREGPKRSAVTKIVTKTGAKRAKTSKLQKNKNRRYLTADKGI